MKGSISRVPDIFLWYFFLLLSSTGSFFVFCLLTIFDSHTWGICHRTGNGISRAAVAESVATLSFFFPLFLFSLQKKQQHIDYEVNAPYCTHIHRKKSVRHGGKNEMNEVSKNIQRARQQKKFKKHTLVLLGKRTERRIFSNETKRLSRKIRKWWTDKNVGSRKRIKEEEEECLK